MDQMSRTCLVCQAELGPSARFCPKCGQRAETAWPPAALPPGQPPRAALPSPPAEAPARADWAMTARPQPGYPPPQSFGPQPSRPQPFPQDTATVSPPQRFPGPPQPPFFPPPAAPRPGYGQPGPGRPAGSGPEPGPFQPGVLPAGPPGVPPPGQPRQPPRRHDRNRSGSRLALWILLPLLLIGGGVTVLLAHPFSHSADAAGPARQLASPRGSLSGTAAGSASPAASGSPAASPSASAVSQQQAATSVSAMLARSVSDRSSISSAASDVAACGPSLDSDAKVFDDAASSRKTLLASLSSLPGRSSLPPALISDLTQAWQASVAADQAYAKWASDEISQGCVPNDTSDPGYRATTTPNQDATKWKTAFASQWNPVAAKYSLKQYQQSQL